MTDLDLTDAEERDLEAFENLSDDEKDEVLRDQLCGVPLEACLERFSGRGERREFIGSYGMLKIGTAAQEVLESEELGGPEDQAELAIILLEVLTTTAREAGAHRHKLASGLRALARNLG